MLTKVNDVRKIEMFTALRVLSYKSGDIQSCGVVSRVNEYVLI